MGTINGGRIVLGIKSATMFDGTIRDQTCVGSAFAPVMNHQWRLRLDRVGNLQVFGNHILACAQCVRRSLSAFCSTDGCTGRPMRV